LKLPVSIIALLLTLTAFVATADPAGGGGKHRMTLAPVDGGTHPCGPAAGGVQRSHGA